MQPERDHATADQKGKPEVHGGHQAQSGQDTHADMLRKTAWAGYANIILGVWLLTIPSLFAYGRPALVVSDMGSGALVVILSALALSPRREILRWGVCLVGLWLLFAPLVFWAPNPAVYINDTLVGALLVALSILIPMMPGKAHHEAMMAKGPISPPGWSYNPSSWWQRGPIIAMALAGFFISRYLAAYQLGYIPVVWDGFFGDGTKRILESDVSRAWPVSDAGLGSVSYLIEALSGFMGDKRRWRTMPWMVVMFGFLVVPLGITSIVLVILQPVAVGAWCTLCLVTAAVMLIMIPPSLDEIVAMFQFLGHSRRAGKPFWRTFWAGGTMDADDDVPERPTALGNLAAAFGFETTPWNLYLSAALGVWLMAEPGVLGVSGAAADSSHLIGALIVTWSVIAWGEVGRSVRYLNVPLGAWIVLAPWVLSGAPGIVRWTDLVAGVAVVLLSLPRGSVRERYGGWERRIV